MRVLTIDQVKAGEALPELGYDVTATTVVLGALASRDWRPMHHDRDFAQIRNGMRDIFLNTPNQAAWFERYLTDWTGPYGRLGRMKFRMKRFGLPGRSHGVPRTRGRRRHRRHRLRLGGPHRRAQRRRRLCTECTARIALPAATGDNPWTRRGERWKPDAEAATASARR